MHSSFLVNLLLLSRLMIISIDRPVEGVRQQDMALNESRFFVVQVVQRVI